MDALALQTAMLSEDDESVCNAQGEGWRPRNSLGLDDGRWARRRLRQVGGWRRLAYHQRPIRSWKGGVESGNSLFFIA